MQRVNDRPAGLVARLLTPEDRTALDSTEIDRLCDTIRETSFQIHKFLRVADRIVVELKACRGLVDEHIAQLLGYLRASRIEHGLLINFGGQKLQVKKYILSRETQSLVSMTGFLLCFLCLFVA